jgi:hypothetical protein
MENLTENKKMVYRRNGLGEVYLLMCAEEQCLSKSSRVSKMRLSASQRYLPSAVIFGSMLDRFVSARLERIRLDKTFTSP